MNNSEQNPQSCQTDVRRSAMSWWNKLSSGRKTQICDANTDLVGSIRRWETLTGSEIEKLFNKEYSLFFETCRNYKCVYNVANNCKCTHIGSTCQSHYA